MRTMTVIWVLLLAGLAWAVALAEDLPVAAAALPNGRYALAVPAVARVLEGAGVAVRAEQVTLPGALTAAVAAPTLRVSGAEARGEGELTVRLRCEAAAECLPFFAEVKMATRPEAVAAAERLRAGMQPGVRAATVGASTVHSAAIAGRAEAVQRLMVGAPVRLELTDARMRIVLRGVAMDAGVPGAEVRVASLDRRQTYRGVVVDARTVKGGVE